MDAVTAARGLAQLVWHGQTSRDVWEAGGLNAEDVVRVRLSGLRTAALEQEDLRPKARRVLRGLDLPHDAAVDILNAWNAALATQLSDDAPSPLTLFERASKLGFILLRGAVIQGLAGRQGRWAVSHEAVAPARIAQRLYRGLPPSDFRAVRARLAGARRAWQAKRWSDVVRFDLDADRLVRTPSGLLRTAAALAELGDPDGARWAIRVCLLEPPHRFEGRAAHEAALALESRLSAAAGGPPTGPNKAELEPTDFEPAAMPQAILSRPLAPPAPDPRGPSIFEAVLLTPPEGHPRGEPAPAGGKPAPIPVLDPASTGAHARAAARPPPPPAGPPPLPKARAVDRRRAVRPTGPRDPGPRANTPVVLSVPPTPARSKPAAAKKKPRGRTRAELEAAIATEARTDEVAPIPSAVIFRAEASTGPTLDTVPDLVPRFDASSTTATPPPAEDWARLTRLVVPVPIHRPARRKAPRAVRILRKVWPLWSLPPPASEAGPETALLPLEDLVDEEIDAALHEILLQLDAPDEGVSAVEPAEETETETRLPAHAEAKTQDVFSEEILFETPVPEVVSLPWPRAASEAISAMLASEAPSPAPSIANQDSPPPVAAEPPPVRVAQLVSDDVTEPGPPLTPLERLRVYVLDVPRASIRLAARAPQPAPPVRAPEDAPPAVSMAHAPRPAAKAEGAPRAPNRRPPPRAAVPELPPLVPVMSPPPAAVAAVPDAPRPTASAPESGSALKRRRRAASSPRARPSADPALALPWNWPAQLEAVITERAAPEALARESRARSALAVALPVVVGRQYEETLQVRARRAPLLPPDPHR